jgi:hypothetical protein
MKGLVAQLEHLGGRQDPDARAQRDRIDEQFTARYDEHAAAKAELETLTAAQPAAEDQHQATITATITDQIPGIIHALLDDPRTDNDTANPARTNPPVAAIAATTLRDRGLPGGQPRPAEPAR